MRTPRLRIFTITVNGLKTWTENAGNRVTEEVQHALATDPQRFGGQSVRVQEKFIGGAKAPREARDARDVTQEPQ